MLKRSSSTNHIDKRLKYWWGWCQRMDRSLRWQKPIMTSSNGNIFRVTGHLCGKFTGHRWIPLTIRSVTRRFYVFFDLRLNKWLSKQSWGWWFETPSRPLWRHCNAFGRRGRKIKTRTKWINFLNERLTRFAICFEHTYCLPHLNIFIIQLWVQSYWNIEKVLINKMPIWYCCVSLYALLYSRCRHRSPNIPHNYFQ